MPTINIDRREVPKTNRNGRLVANSGASSGGGSSSGSGSIDSTGFLKKDASKNNYVFDLPMTDASGNQLYRYDASLDLVVFKKTVVSEKDVIAYWYDVSAANQTNILISGLKWPLYMDTSSHINIKYDPSTISVDGSKGLQSTATAGVDLTSRLNITDSSLLTLTNKYNFNEASLGTLTNKHNITEASLGTLTNRHNFTESSLGTLTNKHNFTESSLGNLTAVKFDASILGLTNRYNKTEASLGTLTNRHNITEASLGTYVKRNFSVGSTKIALTGTGTGAVLETLSIDVVEGNLTISNMVGTLATDHGGTGRTTIGTALQVLRVNAGANGLEYATPTSGTVTSVGFSIPTGFSIANSPVTTSGTLALTYAAGYSLPTDSSQNAWGATITALNKAALTTNKLIKYDGTKLVSSSILDNGTTVTVYSPLDVSVNTKAQSYEIKNTSGSTVWTVALSGTDLVFKNSSNVAKAKLDQNGNLTAVGDVTAYGSI
jgi:hypothetical protein